METMTKKGNGTKGSLGKIVDAVGDLAKLDGNQHMMSVPNPLAFTGVKVFSATKQRDRDYLGEIVTDWLRAHPNAEIVDKVVTQSSDSEFHCVTITLFFNDK